MATASVKNWTEFQHYKNRCPPWIKLQKSILDNFEFACLPIASKALAPLLWLLASESMDGSVRIDAEWLSFRLRFTVQDIRAGITPLIEKGFLTVASDVLAECLQDACLEGEGEGETEKKADAIAPAPSVSEKPKKPKSAAVTITTWLASLGDADAIPANDPIFDYAEKAGISPDFLTLSWLRFVETHKENGKRQASWPATYRNAVRSNWYKLWWFTPTGECQLTTTGEQARRVAA